MTILRTCKLKDMARRNAQRMITAKLKRDPHFRTPKVDRRRN
jgi:hypothetical protein